MPTPHPGPHSNEGAPPGVGPGRHAEADGQVCASQPVTGSGACPLLGRWLQLQ